MATESVGGIGRYLLGDDLSYGLDEDVAAANVVTLAGDPVSDCWSQGSVMVGSLSCSRRRRWMRGLRSSPVLGREKVCVESDQSSL